MCAILNEMAACERMMSFILSPESRAVFNLKPASWQTLASRITLADAVADRESWFCSLAQSKQIPHFPCGLAKKTCKRMQQKSWWNCAGPHSLLIADFFLPQESGSRRYNFAFLIALQNWWRVESQTSHACLCRALTHRVPDSKSQQGAKP